ncbi:MAG: phosphopentomutase [Candidatus Gastranaerophilales bacterium]|nr:phosphopentomutase [Candidatus Gastranaerophilales bacterium]
MRRVILIVIDSAGVGAMEDAPEYSDALTCNTLANTAKIEGGLNLPVMQKMGLGNIIPIEGVALEEIPTGSFGKMREKSKGKDTTTGHWEIAGLILNNPFKTYPDGFPQELIEEFITKTNCGGILGNIPASGTEIINNLGEEHIKTGFPIVYTSADSVFQIAVHIEVTPLETLYQWCEVARELLDEKYNVSRVIARPFEGTAGSFKRISKNRHDYSLMPPSDTMLNLIEKDGKEVFGVGKIEDIFVKSGVTRAVHISCNKEGLEYTLDAIKNSQSSLIFTNLVDTDMLYGHRRDASGYKNALEEIDSYLEKITGAMKEDDLLIITADHGCDPTANGSDHTREYVPVLVYGKNNTPCNLGVRNCFCDISATVLKYLGINGELEGMAFEGIAF